MGYASGLAVGLRVVGRRLQNIPRVLTIVQTYSWKDFVG